MSERIDLDELDASCKRSALDGESADDLAGHFWPYVVGGLIDRIRELEQAATRALRTGKCPGDEYCANETCEAAAAWNALCDAVERRGAVRRG